MQTEAPCQRADRQVLMVNDAKERVSAALDQLAASAAANVPALVSPLAERGS